jgi:hypothetical protein
MGMDMAYLAMTWKLGRKQRLDAAGRSLYEGGTIKTRADLKHIKDPGDDDIKKRLDEMCAAVDGTARSYSSDESSFDILPYVIGLFMRSCSDSCPSRFHRVH